jgi:hypothetical protein
MVENNQTITELINLASSLNRSIPIPLLIFGTIGNALNIFILTRKSLRTNSCSFYFLSSTIANLICLWCGLFTRLLSGYNLDPTVWNTTICKFRFFITYMSLSLSACFLVYASIDRWSSSSLNARRRLFSSIHIARRMVLYTIIIACLAYGQAFYCYSSVPGQFPVTCYCPNIICRMYNDILFLILFSIIPPIFMLTFGLITIQNVKRIRQQVHPHIMQNNRHQHLMKRKDRQMITMLFIQVVLFFVCVTPSGISKAYTTLTLNQYKDALELTKENFFFQVKFTNPFFFY